MYEYEGVGQFKGPATYGEGVRGVGTTVNCHVTDLSAVIMGEGGRGQVRNQLFSNRHFSVRYISV